MAPAPLARRSDHLPCHSSPLSGTLPCSVHGVLSASTAAQGLGAAKGLARRCTASGTGGPRSPQREGFGVMIGLAWPRFPPCAAMPGPSPRPIPLRRSPAPPSRVAQAAHHA
ncbi:hypothetical protein GUJ93_ZPchr0009g1622 [Zizania palustris]|uniref:Uncharacterized protein n=1 Tax=Zizania palustris TaxID=103762 RepID=A0A8J5V4T6_ZIZPA|nr:hypothetical protein GUJ93_ZPchr0009g1622 [Zizania palustris]